SGTITISNSGGNGIFNFSTITNSGTITISNSNGSTGITNSGTINNSGTITISDSVGNGIVSEGTITNSGTITNLGTIDNSGTITNSGTIVVKCGGTVTGIPIILNEPVNQCVFLINDVTVSEGNSGTIIATFTITLLDQTHPMSLAVSYMTAPGTATQGTDYTTIPATITTFAANEFSKPVPVSIIGDTMVEPNETFFVNLSLPTGAPNAAISDSQGLGTIINDDNTAPTAQDDSFTILEDGSLSASVIATDAENDSLSYMIVGSTPTGLIFNSDGTFTYTPTSNFSGTISFQFKANDGESDSNIALVTITVTPVNDAPVCSAPTAAPYIWPPNHKMVLINAAMSASDVDGDTVTTAITSIFQDEPTNGLGDGDTSPDANLGLGQVRAERSGTGDGRVYVVTLTASDGNGGSCSGTVQVIVPHSMKKPVTAVNSGAIYDSTTP
ncbi:MAG: Ig-like domain-containing protein, partial [Nitrosopumilaceae archaeon]